MAGRTAAGVDVATPERISASDQALSYLQRLIDLRKVPLGDPLPSAAALSAQIGVNRMAVLEAFQALQRDGLVMIRPGPGGARIVPRADRAPAQRLARAVGKQDAILKMHLLRGIVESGIVRTVAERGLSDEQLARARDLVKQMRTTSDRDGYVALDVAFHELLARATGSPLVAELSIALRWMFVVALDAVDLDAARLRTASKEHEKMLAAIARGAAAAAADHAYHHATTAMTLVVEQLSWHDALAALEAEASGPSAPPAAPTRVRPAPRARPRRKTP